jgi:hypothetical protein
LLQSCFMCVNIATSARLPPVNIQNREGVELMRPRPQHRGRETMRGINPCAAISLRRERSRIHKIVSLSPRPRPLRAMRNPGEGYSDVILRLAAEGGMTEAPPTHSAWGDQSAIVENQQSICSQKENDVGVISIQNSRGPHAGVAERRNVIARLRSGFGCEDRNSRCNEAAPSSTMALREALDREASPTAPILDSQSLASHRSRSDFQVSSMVGPP